MKPRTLYGLLILILVLLIPVSLLVGYAHIPILKMLSANPPEQADALWLILTEIRLPRLLLAMLVGASLGMSGAALQGFLRNPLADAGIIGISSSASLGAVLALYTGLAASFSLALPLGGMAGAGLAVLLIYGLAGRDSSILTLILAGVAVNAFASALTSLTLNLAPNPYAALEIVYWLLGSIADRSFDQVWLCLPFIVAGCVLMLMSGSGLDALSLGDDAAASLGISLNRLRLQIILGTALAVGAAVAVSGAIGFIGLVVPHLLRPLAGHQPSRLLGLSALGGSVLLLMADISLRMIPTELELKLGVVTALIGAPFFLYLLMATRRQMQ